MSLTAVDHYLAGVPLPQDTRPPAEGTPLYEHLLERQNESLGPGGVMATAFMRWMMLPEFDGEHESTSGLTSELLPGIIARLDRGEVVPLGLVLVRARGNDRGRIGPVGDVWANHQVVAYAYEQLEGGIIDLRIYDPNYPQDDAVIVRLAPTAAAAAVDDGAPRIGQRVTGDGRRTAVRGVFPMPYTRRQPFAAPTP